MHTTVGACLVSIGVQQKQAMHMGSQQSASTQKLLQFLSPQASQMLQSLSRFLQQLMGTATTASPLLCQQQGKQQLKLSSPNSS
jgi:hypothetical protein